jgi:hypothetical protein
MKSFLNIYSNSAYIVIKEKPTEVNECLQETCTELQ